MNNAHESLDDWRKHIDTIDNQILDLLSKRMELSVQIGEYKAQMGLPALDSKRWQSLVVNRLKVSDRLGLPRALVLGLFDLIHTHSLSVQRGRTIA